MRQDLDAAATWDRLETLDVTNARIHDGVDGEEGLRRRANDYVKFGIFGLFPRVLPAAGASILEVGSGVGWIMQAVDAHLRDLGAPAARIVGLDIAPNMLAKARARLGDAVPFAWELYDGISVPFPPASFDLIYSVACLQHVPRPYVFNLFFEFHRLLKPGGSAVIHLMSTDFLPRQSISWREEIDNQVHAREAHWHHFYTEKELRDVLAATGFGLVDVRDIGGGTLFLRMAHEGAGAPRVEDSEAARWRQECATLRASTSWRVTAPLRALGRETGPLRALGRVLRRVSPRRGD